MTAHYLLYTSDREHGGKLILGIFNSYEKALEHYLKTHDENARYYNIWFIEQWENDKLILEQ